MAADTIIRDGVKYYKENGPEIQQEIDNAKKLIRNKAIRDAAKVSSDRGANVTAQRILDLLED